VSNDYPNHQPAKANQSEYLKPWSRVTDEELGLLRRIRELCAPLAGLPENEVLSMPGGRAFRIGEVGHLVQVLRDVGK
jgi:hypothetical protein